MAAPQSERNFCWDQGAAFRLKRHHFLDRRPAAITRLCGDVCGVQAQVMGAAQTALWTRAHNLSREQIESALWKQRALIRTSLMRQTLHLIPAADFFLYITALKPSRMGYLLRIMTPFGITRKDVDAMNAVLLDLLDDKPVPQRELAEKVRPKLSKGLQRFMELFWSVVRPAVVEGLICYGPEQGREITVVRVDRWLAKQKPSDEHKAKQILLRRYLAAYGPASVQDFCKWSGILAKEAGAVWQSMAPEMVDVSVEGAKKMILRDDLKELKESELGEDVVRLLPGFDPYLLAHVDKSHLVDERHYKKVYRNQGWVSPVVLLNGRVIGTWTYGRQPKKPGVQVELFGKVSKRVRELMQEETEKLESFFSREFARMDANQEKQKQVWGHAT